MSGDGNSGGGGEGFGGGSRGSGGFDLNSFGDWGGMYNVLGNTDTGASPGTQGSTTPAAYQIPHFDVDAYTRPSPPQRYGHSPGLSQIPENYPDNRSLGYRPIGGGSAWGINAEAAEEEEEEEGDDEVLVDGGRHPYSGKETLALYDAWITVSYDPVVGNQQSRLCFWQKVTDLYNERRPKKTFARNVKMLRGHWDRCDKDVKKFCAIYRAEEANYQSGASGADILRAALRVFKDDTGKDFKHVDVWSQVAHLERWAGGVQSGEGSGSSSKRTKHTASGQYSSSEGGSGSGNTNTSQEGTPTPTDDAGGSTHSRRRPQGSKAAKAARARGRGRGRGESSQAGSGSGSGTGSNTLMSMYLLATMADMSKMSPLQAQAHMDGIEHMRAQLGIRSNLGAPPPGSGDDSPAE